MPLNEDVVQSVANENFKVAAGGPTFWTNMSMGDAVSHQRVVNGIREAAFGAMVKSLSEYDIAEALGYKHASSAPVGAGERSMDLGAVVAALQQLIKTAQTTRPETGAG